MLLFTRILHILWRMWYLFNLFYEFNVRFYRALQKYQDAEICME